MTQHWGSSHTMLGYHMCTPMRLLDILSYVWFMEMKVDMPGKKVELYSKFWGGVCHTCMEQL